MERIDLIIIIVYLLAIVIVALSCRKEHQKTLIPISWETGNYPGGYLVHLEWRPILILLEQ